MELLALAPVINELNQLTESDEVSVNQLADAIMKDATLTSRVLRVANSVMYNPGGLHVTTISRAIVQLGFTTIRSISVSVMVLESLLNQSHQSRLLNALAKAFHAAVQAKNLCKGMAPESQEEAFVAALLYRLGELMFWSCERPEVEQLNQLWDSASLKEKNGLCREVLGVAFPDLTTALAKHWKLSSVLTKALSPETRTTRKVAAVILADEISQKADLGLDQPAFKPVLKKACAFLKCDEKQALALLKASADEAAQTANTFGSPEVCRLIPSDNPVCARSDAAGFNDTAPEQLKANPQLQLEMLHELSTMLLGSIDMNTLFQVVMEGLHRGVGLERVMLALFHPKRTHMQAKYLLGEKLDDWRERFVLAVSSQDYAPVKDTFELAQCVRVLAGKPQPESITRPALSLFALVGSRNFFMGPVCANGKPVGLFYADCAVSQQELTDAHFRGFQQFVQQANMGLRLIAGG